MALSLRHMVNSGLLNNSRNANSWNRGSQNFAGQLGQERVTGFQAGLNPLQKILDLFGPDYGKGIERNAMANMNADFISRGLGSTTLPVAASVNMKAQTEDIRRNRLAEALRSVSQYVLQSTPQPGDVLGAATDYRLAPNWSPTNSTIFGNTNSQLRRW